MSQVQCPVCFTPLEVRDVAPCYICGGWPSRAERLVPRAEFREWRLPGGRTLVLCAGCEVEEFLSPHGWGRRLGLGGKRLPLAALQLVRVLPRPEVRKDKFCPHCNLRLAFLEVVAAADAGDGV